ncbi:Fatty acid oxidation complex subunit alpha [Candidatus Lokiarchaeum ossiferum]|uniref:Fatty acid oxidation complex subunit alpha n=1 Tax=Candidatus Lokiarchaeum ossiferum TaxID=2951803 RepID=A0ABY6HZE6_9ARCH|nr:Fatty acid oxidation complex subunit alpha [Candidatus Lokiarchaeum sp. B-35]
MEIKNIVVIGAGLMGMGVVQVSLQKGYKVTVVDIKDEFIDRGVSGLKKGLDRLEQKGRLGEGVTTASILEKMSTTTDLAAAVKDADLILEAVIENMKIKQDVFKTCADNAPDHCIIATNTSSMSVTEIANASGKADKCVGIHFFNPVPLMRLVEIIKGDGTSDETMDIAVAWAEGLPCRGKRYCPRVLKDRPGFIANRMIAPGFVLMNWAFDEAVAKGVTWEELEADTVKETSPMGFLELGDYVGHDTYYHINNYYAKTLSPDFTPGKAYTEMYETKKLGRKVGQGFFDWTQGRPKIDRSKKAGIVTAEQLDAIEANEGCRLLEEGVVKNWQVIDDTMMAGFNRPGVMELATQNYEKWSTLLAELAAKIGKDYIKPCEFLKSGKFVGMK